ncbi:MAG: hypothetical protein Q9192_003592 [Flavoplaca navasiana]
MKRILRLLRQWKHAALQDAPTSKADILQNTLVGPQALPTDGLNHDGLTGGLSAYSERRATIRNLTLPTIFDLEIPPSPPGSPSPEISQKFEYFMQLKKQGLHFNEKLGGSSALKNPLLLHKLMSSAGLREADQYATPLPKCLWNPKAFPAWAYDEALIRSEQDLMSRKEDENTRKQRDRVNFIPATKQDRSSLEGIPTMTPGSTASASSTAETVSADLDKDQGRTTKETSGRPRRDFGRRQDREFNQGLP